MNQFIRIFLNELGTKVQNINLLTKFQIIKQRYYLNNWEKCIVMKEGERTFK